ncbi:LysE family translocator [Nesterenkonia sp.]|uniref:LysE family translocator n=1 Tax=Nesterenkonia sp. TaxID=704201 RepID=UPI00260E2A57|nr:LysE family translocator [Nesterenkonia sp.]
MPILSLILFIIAGSGTPGPNNTIVLASGAAFGFRRTLPAVAGINTGFPLMIVVVGLGLGGLLAQWPWVLDALRPVGAAYLLWLAWKIATGPTDLKARREGRPPGVLQMAFFQLVNPKAWTLAIAALTAYTGFWSSFLAEVLTIAAVAAAVGLPCTLTWVMLGVGAGRFLSTPRQLRIFNLVMAALLVVSLLPVLAEILDSILPLLDQSG